jgi:flagellar hook assembly protein FlgD
MSKDRGNYSMKKLVSILLVFILSLGLFAVDIHADSDKYVKQIYVGQPTDKNHEKYSYALFIKTNVVGYKDKNLRIRIKSSDGTELESVKLSKAVSNDTNYIYYWDGKDDNGKFYKDGTYTIQTWIYGDDSTLVTKSYKLDLKGNDTTTPTALKKSAKVTYMGQPDDKNSKYYNYAMMIKLKVTGYKGKTAVGQVFDPSGKLVTKINYNIVKDEDTHNFYYKGYGYDGKWTGNGTYKVKFWVDGYQDATEETWSNSVTLKTTNAKHIEIRSLKKSDSSKGRYVTNIATAGYKGETVVVGYKDSFGDYYELNRWTLKTNSPEGWNIYLDAYNTDSVTITAYIEGYSDTTYKSQGYNLN